MKTRRIVTILLSLAFAMTQIGFACADKSLNAAAANGSGTSGESLISVDNALDAKDITKIKSAHARPSKVKNVTVKFPNFSVKGFKVNWDKVKGATGYQLQYKGDDGKWRTYFYEYNKYAEKRVKTYPDEWTSKKNRYNVRYITLGTTAYWATDYANESLSFRVRAYKTVDGKKVFGRYSEPATIEQVWKTGDELQDFVHTWVDENYPTYDRASEETGYADLTPEKGTSWCTDWTYCTVNKYETKEYILDIFCEKNLRTYFASTWGLAEDTRGVLYTRDLGNGYYQVWWLG